MTTTSALDADSAALPTPWHASREWPHPVVTNASDEPLEFARAIIRVGDRVTTERWGIVLPDDENEICLCGLDTSDLCVTLSWRRAGIDEELLWQFVL